MLRFLTAGETHGPSLTAVLEGLPAGLKIDESRINEQLRRRQSGYGRGGRMKIEADKVIVTSGVRNGKTIGAPLALIVENRDWANWSGRKSARLSVPRPGHADLAGSLKYGLSDIRDVLERASARETAARTALGAVCRLLLDEFHISIYSFLRQLGPVKSIADYRKIISSYSRVEKSQLRTFENEKEMMAVIDRTIQQKDTVGGIVEVVIRGCPVGLGSHVQWDRKLDSRLAQAVMSVQAIKGVEFGDGFSIADRPGSEVHDEIFHSSSKGYFRKTNRAGGIEGGISNGEDIVLRAVMKPIPTLMKPLQSVDMDSKKAAVTFKERSDVCALPAAGVVLENVCAFVIADEFMNKFGGDSVAEIRKRFKV